GFASGGELEVVGGNVSGRDQPGLGADAQGGPVKQGGGEPEVAGQRRGERVGHAAGDEVEPLGVAGQEGVGEQALKPGRAGGGEVNEFGAQGGVRAERRLKAKPDEGLVAQVAEGLGTGGQLSDGGGRGDGIADAGGVFEGDRRVQRRVGGDVDEVESGGIVGAQVADQLNPVGRQAADFGGVQAREIGAVGDVANRQGQRAQPGAGVRPAGFEAGEREAGQRGPTTGEKQAVVPDDVDGGEGVGVLVLEVGVETVREIEVAALFREAQEQQPGVEVAVRGEVLGG